jgi:hypothetical protein
LQKELYKYLKENPEYDFHTSVIRRPACA